MQPQQPQPQPLGKPTAPQLQAIQQHRQAYENKTDAEKVQYDSLLWSRTINSPGNAVKGDILENIFSVLRWGGLYFRSTPNQTTWQSWSLLRWPIASALSHGGRVMIQLPRTDPRRNHDRDDRFFDWLTLNQKGTPICFERQGTHSTGNRPKDWKLLPDGRIKVLKELHGSTYGGSQKTGVSSGKSYGINLALGGNLNHTFATNVLIADNGSHGHLYIYYRPPTKEMYGGVLIGCEGEAPGCYGASGNFHSWNLAPVDELRGHKPSRHEGQFGPKWSQNFQLPDRQQQLINGPAQYDSTIVDLTAGWEFLMQEAEDFTSNMVGQPAEPPRQIPPVPKHPGWMQLLRAASRGGALVASAGWQKYENLPLTALQLRLDMLIDLKDMRVGGGRLRDNPAYQTEYNSLVNAIYGN